MADETDEPPTVITPFESAYIRGAAYFIVPIINQLIDATDLDVKLHITHLTQNGFYKFALALLAAAGFVKIIWKRVKDGKDPASAAATVVLRKPADELPAPPTPPAVSA